MKKKKRYHKKLKFTYIKATLFSLFAGLLVVKGYTPFEQTGENLFHITLNGQEVGSVSERERAEELLIQARRNLAENSGELLFMEADMELSGEEVLWGFADEESLVVENMENALRASIRPTLQRSYTVKINEYMLNLSSVEEVRLLLQAALDRYDSDSQFAVNLHYDTGREFGVLTTEITKKTEVQPEETPDMGGGVEDFFTGLTGETEEQTKEEKTFEDYEYGIQSMGFCEDIEVVEVYLPTSQLTSLEDAIALVVMEQETPGIYEVVAGDTLTEIAIKVNIPMDQIIAMNDILEDENTILHIGDQLLITVPEPELSVTRVEEEYYEEVYDADIQYIDNTSWYTNQVVVRQQPSAGFRKVVADVTYVNDKEVSRQILMEEVAMEAVPKIVERGTKVPPTYIKPIVGGRITSSFGYRDISLPGATSNHGAIDWATPTGTTVMASCGGKVVKAGWVGSYGYVIYIDHEDGKQTRYAHLSKILVSVGQTVKQGEKIALSGTTGVSSGPHVHFEIRVNGVAVNPLNYVSR